MGFRAPGTVHCKGGPLSAGDQIFEIGDRPSLYLTFNWRVEFRDHIAMLILCDDPDLEKAVKLESLSQCDKFSVSLIEPKKKQYKARV